MKVKSTFFDSEFPPPKKNDLAKNGILWKCLGFHQKQPFWWSFFSPGLEPDTAKDSIREERRASEEVSTLEWFQKTGDVFVVCLFCSLLCFGVFSFFLDDEFNESSRKTRFLFQKKHMSSTWALSVWATKGRRHSRWEPWVSSLDCFGLSSFESLIWSLPSLERNVDCCDAWEL